MSTWDQVSTIIESGPTEACHVAHGISRGLQGRELWVDFGDEHESISFAKITFRSEADAEAAYCKGVRLAVKITEHPEYFMEQSAWFNRVYTVLVDLGSAAEHMRDSFVFAHINKEHPCREWRFSGNLGYGGKYRSSTNTVDCYQEDVTPLHTELIQKLNQALANLK